jgi:hypothetical protein
MARLLRMNNDSVPSNLTLIAGNTYPFKVSGFGTDKKHIIIKSSSPAVKIIVIKADSNNLEQSLRLEIQTEILNRSQAKLIAYLASQPNQKDLLTQEISVVIEPTMELPPIGTESGAIARVLIVENITPGNPRFFSNDNTLNCMQWMRWVLVNRLRFGSIHFGSKKTTTNLIELIKAPNQIDGFEHYPHISEAKNKMLNDVLTLANDSTNKNFLLYRQYVQNAIDVAQGFKSAIDPCSTGLYAWRTSGKGSPGKNFIPYQSKGGQDFYTLSEAFIKENSKHTTK